jgi:hypothetical protein
MFSLANDFSKRVHPQSSSVMISSLTFGVAVAVNARKGFWKCFLVLKSSSKRVENHFPIAIHNAPRQ